MSTSPYYALPTEDDDHPLPRNPNSNPNPNFNPNPNPNSHHTHHGLDASFLEHESESSHPRTPDLDAFLSLVYQYHCEKGWRPMLLSRLLHLLTLGFSIGLTTFLLVGIDWDTVQLSYQRTAPLTPVVWGTAFCFSLYWLFLLGRLLFLVPQIWGVRRLYHRDLGLGEDDLLYVPWDGVLQRLLAFQQRAPLALSRVQPLDHLAVAQRLLRVDNFLLPLTSHPILARLEATFPLNRVWEWHLRSLLASLLHDMAASNPRVTPERLEAGLKRRARLLGCGHFLLAPFLFLYVAITLLYRYTAEVRASPSLLAHRGWSPRARWLLREYNELPHILHERLAAAVPQTTRYLALFPAPATRAVARTVLFVLGALATVIVLVSLVHDEVFLGREIWGKPLAWYLAILGAAIGATRGFLADSASALPERIGVTSHPDAVLRDLRSLLHVTSHQPLPQGEEGEGEEGEGGEGLVVLSGREAVLQLFPYRFVLYARELWGVLLAPLVLWVWVPRHAPQIVACVAARCVQLQGVGATCAPADFLGAHHLPSTTSHPGGASGGLGLGRADSSSSLLMDRDGDVEAPLVGSMQRMQGMHVHPGGLGGMKMEQSMLSFVAHHPSWPQTTPLGALGASSMLVSQVLSHSGVMSPPGVKPVGAGVRQRPVAPSAALLMRDDGSVPLTGSEISREYYDLLQSYVDKRV